MAMLLNRGTSRQRRRRYKRHARCLVAGRRVYNIAQMMVTRAGVRGSDGARVRGKLQAEGKQQRGKQHEQDEGGPGRASQGHREGAHGKVFLSALESLFYPE
jgi:hypothetical protein